MTQEITIISESNNEIMKNNGVNQLIESIRPEWKSKRLVERTMKLLYVDPSSACQRIFNASIHDLRQKIILIGNDVAKQISQQLKLPLINSDEDIMNYRIRHLIRLANGIGILTRPEYKKLDRAYDIRCDLEHEDFEYEAGIQDVVYIFKSCIDSVLSKEPIGCKI